MPDDSENVYGAPPMFKEGALITAEYYPDRGKYRQSVLGWIVDVDGHTIVIEEVDHQGERDNEHRRVRLHAPSREATSLTNNREISLGTLERVSYIAGPDIDTVAGANQVNSAFVEHAHEMFGGRILEETGGIYKYPDTWSHSDDE